jgi:tetratricopeptide (TPR) repeat protein
MKPQRIYLQISLLVLAVFALYSQSLHAPPFFDDPDFKQLAVQARNHFNFDLRWLSHASLGWTVNWLGNDIFWLRSGNVLLHASNVVALFFLLKQLFGITLISREPADEAGTRLGWFAFFGSFLFALHPLAVYGVGYLIQRSTLMATLFVLLMLITYLRGLLQGGWHWMIIAALCYFAALYSKEHSIAAPAVAFALTFLVRRPSLGLLKQITPYYLVCALSAASIIYLTNKMGLIAHAYEPNAAVVFEQATEEVKQAVSESPNIFLLSMLTQSWLFFKYLVLWLIPNPAWVSVDMREPFAISLWSWPHTLGLLGFLTYPCVAIWLLLKQGKRGLLGFALLFPWLLFLTEMSTVRAQEPFVMYRSYLWMPGLFAALPVVCVALPPKRAFLFLGVLAVLFVPLSLNRLHTFSSGLLLWDDAEKLVRDKRNVIGAERIYGNRGIELVKLKRYEEAIGAFTRSIEIFPWFDFTHLSRAEAYYRIKKYPQALAGFNRAIELKPENPRSYYGRALTYRALGYEDYAQSDLRQGCALGGVCR